MQQIKFIYPDEDLDRKLNLFTQKDAITSRICFSGQDLVIWLRMVQERE